MKFLVVQIKLYISKHMQEHIPLNDIAKEVGYSKYHIARILKMKQA